MDNNRLKWREAFTFTRSELRGFRLLTLLLVLVVVGRIIYYQHVSPPVLSFDVPPEWMVDDSLQSFSDSLQPKARRKYKSRPWKERRNEPGSIRSQWPRDSVQRRTYAPAFKRSRIIELNTADTIDLRALPAIGPWLARKIVEYRERLGGFRHAEQLLEVYRLTPGKLDTILPFITIDTLAVSRIDVNTITAEELMKHPYLSRSQARGLMAYRDKHGRFGTLTDLKKCLLIDEKTFEKVCDYMEVR